MKLGRLVVNILKISSYRGCMKRRKLFPPYGLFKDERINIPYKDDNNPQHTFDVLLAEKYRKNVCILDIHGGAYIFGEHIDNYIFGKEFVKEGYDVVLVDYEPNNGKIDTKDLVDDIVDNFNYVFSHLKELGLENDKFVITGDSAGGHFALLLSELILNKEYAKELGYSFPEIELLACLVNCTVFDFVHISDGNLSKSGRKRMFGPNYHDVKAFEALCPKVHIDSLTCPVFISTCKHDFLRKQSYMLHEELLNRGIKVKLVDINSDEKHVGHVHNVLHPEHYLAIEVNKQMMEFIDECNKK